METDDKRRLSVLIDAEAYRKLEAQALMVRQTLDAAVEDAIAALEEQTAYLQSQI